MNDDKLDELIVELAREGNSPPPTPREEMWSEIVAVRRFEPRRAAWVNRAWLPAAAGIAAVLMLGIGLGRLSVQSESGDAVMTSADGTQIEPDPAGGAAYRLVANEHLGQAELLLTSFRSEAETGEIDARVGVWAKELLTTTRLLLDSPAGEKPELRLLLEDLELVLAQLSQLPATGSTDESRMELQLASEAIEEAGVLPKIRTAIQDDQGIAMLNQEEL